MNVASYWWSDKIVLSMSGAKEAKHDEYTDLYHIVENLSITAGLPMPKVYIMTDPSPNAFATGRDPEHGVICFTTGILQNREKIEIANTQPMKIDAMMIPSGRSIMLAIVV